MKAALSLTLGGINTMDESRNAPTAGGEDFSTLFEQSMSVSDVRPGEVVHGKVVLVSRDFVTVDIGFKSEGQIPIHEFLDRAGNVDVQPGDEIDVFFDGTESEHGGVLLSKSKAEQFRVWRDIEEAFNKEQPIEGKIVGKVKGGLKVDVGVPAFLPGSHADIRPVRNLDKYLGETGEFAILKFNRARGNVVVSRRAIMEKERELQREQTLKVLEEGIILEGVVKNITDYGAFVDLGGIDGLLHVTDMSWGRVAKPSDVIKVGDTLKVVVLKYDAEKGRVSLGMKQIMPDPWASVAERYPVGSRVTGKVVSLADYGAFVELEPGIEGLVHVSEMSWTKRITHPSKVLEPGQDVEVLVLDVDAANRRVSLGLKQAMANPWEQLRIDHPIGSHVSGTVKHITDFGVFVGIEEGIDGLVHISDMSWTQRVKHPSELFQKGDEVEAVLLNIDTGDGDKPKISLGIKQLVPDPWDRIPNDYPAGKVVDGKILKVLDFGAFVELEKGVEGLVHVSEISEEHVEDPRKVLNPGQEVQVQVLDTDAAERKIGLSIKGAARSIGSKSRMIIEKPRCFFTSNHLIVKTPGPS